MKSEKTGAIDAIGRRRCCYRPFFWIIALVVAAFAVVPLIGNNVELRESLLLAAVYITLASNLNIMLGYAGYINFGSIVFFGLGGYISVYLISALRLAAGGGRAGRRRCRERCWRSSSVSASCACAAPSSRSRPSASTRRSRPSSPISSRGAAPPASISRREHIRAARRADARRCGSIYFLLVAVMGLSLYLSYAIKTSKFGLGLIAIGQNEDAAAVLGVPTPLYKALAYSLSAFLPALAGGLYFFKSAFIQPSDAFDLSLSTEAIVIVMLGGRGTVTGAAIGAYLYEELRGWLLTSETFSQFPAGRLRRAPAHHRAVRARRADGLDLRPLAAHEAGARMTRAPRGRRPEQELRRRCSAVSELSFAVDERRDPRPDRAERRRKVDRLQPDQRRLCARRGAGDVSRRRHHRQAALSRRAARSGAHAPDRAAARRPDRAGELHGRRLLRAREPAARARARGGARGRRSSSASKTGWRRRRRSSPSPGRSASSSPARSRRGRCCCCSTRCSPASTRPRSSA